MKPNPALAGRGLWYPCTALSRDSFVSLNRLAHAKPKPEAEILGPAVAI
jgi:hypothetical protein